MIASTEAEGATLQEKLTKAVQATLEDGWQPFGSPLMSQTHLVLYQAVVRPEQRREPSMPFQ